MRGNVAVQAAGRHPISGNLVVIASEAKQSIAPQGAKWIASSLTLLAMTVIPAPAAC
jgi:hypothetical protein